ncbi:hypothetical protein [Sphingobium sp. Ant17]|uniref:hypothetical protein n=1 Tax=Sphingobium sp. Ant17 TaxID=1461752 RepID=UPI001269676C|nr:hypothetical protein [Sphingobium sp. Ant17]
MSSKFNIQINVDLKDIAPERKGEFNPEIAAAVFQDLILRAARLQMKTQVEATRARPDLDSDVKTIKMAENLRGMMLGIMAEANMTVTELPADTIISTELPFERKYGDGEAA